MKLLFDSLDALLTELGDREVTLVRVAPAVAIEPGPETQGERHLVSRVVVTAALGRQAGLPRAASGC